MAITAAIALSAATCTAEQPIGVVCTVTNGNASSVDVMSVTPTMTPASATKQSVSSAQGLSPVGPGMTVAVAASGTLALAWTVVPHAPAAGGGLANPASHVYDVGALVYTSDGSITAATIATLTVSNPTH